MLAFGSSSTSLRQIGAADGAERLAGLRDVATDVRGGRRDVSGDVLRGGDAVVHRRAREAGALRVLVSVRAGAAAIGRPLAGHGVDSLDHGSPPQVDAAGGEEARGGVDAPRASAGLVGALLAAL